MFKLNMYTVMRINSVISIFAFLNSKRKEFASRGKFLFKSNFFQSDFAQQISNREFIKVFFTFVDIAEICQFTHLP